MKTTWNVLRKKIFTIFLKDIEVDLNKCRQPYSWNGWQYYKDVNSLQLNQQIWCNQKSKFHMDFLRNLLKIFTSSLENIYKQTNWPLKKKHKGDMSVRIKPKKWNQILKKIDIYLKWGGMQLVLRGYHWRWN